jgi:hypothetical protein
MRRHILRVSTPTYLLCMVVLSKTVWLQSQRWGPNLVSYEEKPESRSFTFEDWVLIGLAGA